MAKHKKRQKDRYHWEFQIGTAIVVSEPKYTYAYYEEMAIKMGIRKMWIEKFKPEQGDILKIIARELHPDNDKEIYGVYNADLYPHACIMDAEGFRKYS